MTVSSAVLVCGPDRLLGVSDVRPTGGPDAEMAGRVELGGHHVGPDGRTAAGALGVLIDEVLGYSLIHSLQPSAYSVSTELSVDLLAPLPASGSLRARAHTVRAGSWSIGEVYDEDGRVLAHCRERGRRIEDVPRPDSLPPLADAVPNTGGLREALGIGPDDAFVVTPSLENPRRMLHGGVSFAAAELAATADRVRAGSDLATVSVHCLHTRPAPYGATVELRTTTVHAGRSLWVTDVTGSVEGRTVVSARVTAQ